MISRASTRFGTPAAIVATVTISAFVSKSRPIVTRCAIYNGSGEEPASESRLCGEIDDKVKAFLARPIEATGPICGSTPPT